MGHVETPATEIVDERPIDAQGTIARDIPCVGCGYNLRGLSAASTCPECGVGLSQSLNQYRLVLADPAWLRTLSRGFSLILLGLVFAAVMFALLVGAMAFVGTGADVLGPLLVWLFTVPPGGVVFYGCWEITTPEPRVGYGGADAARRVARVCATAIMALAALALPCFGVVSYLEVTVFLLGGLAATIGGFAALYYGRAIASRIPDAALERGTTFQMWGYAGLIVAVFTVIGMGTVIVWVEQSKLSQSIDTLTAIIAVLALLLVLAGFAFGGAMGLLTLVLFIRFQIVLKRLVTLLDAD